jgi:hypothetical protein
MNSYTIDVAENGRLYMYTAGRCYNEELERICEFADWDEFFAICNSSSFRKHNPFDTVDKLYIHVVRD